jgi:hypothetical protein
MEIDFTALSRAVLNHAPVLSACLCVLLDWDAPRRALVQQLRAFNLPLRVLVVGGSSTLDPGPMADQAHHLHWIDPEHIAAGLARL